MSCFGVPITDDTLKAMSRYKGRSITQEDRAREAMRLINAEDKNMDALNHVLKVKSEYGDGVCTLCLLYNATGDTLELVEKKDWLGCVTKEEPPRSFDNGQWLVFLHVHPTSQDLGCQAARVYRAKNIKGVVRDFMVAWSTSSAATATQNSAYTEIGEIDLFPQCWDNIKEKKLESANKITKDETDEDFTSTVSIGGMRAPEFIAIFRHKFSTLS